VPSSPRLVGLFCTHSAAPVSSLHFFAALLALMLLAPYVWAAEEDGEARKPETNVAGKCTDCGVLRSIREIRTERQLKRPDIYVTSPQYLATREEPPRIGPVISFSWGNRADQNTTQIGAVGSPQMQQRFIDISYELTVKFDDGRYALIEQDDVGSLGIGDRVRVVDKRVVRMK
jgi:hypothetical protein